MDKISLINHVYKNKLLVDFLKNKEEISSFHNGNSFESLNENFLSKKEISTEKRKLLVEVISNQYDSTKLSVPDNVIQLLKKGTYTITTGHQLCLFSGPQYFIHKIISIIKSSLELNKKYPNSHFVPLFWMASEDHDFEEISSINLFGKELKVNDSFNKPVGELNPKVFSPVLNELKELLKNEPKSNELIKLFSDSFNQSSWSNATRFYLNQLFGKYGLVVLDANDKILKDSFASIMKKEIDDKFIYNSVIDSNSKISEKGYKPSINPRELNLFYLNKDSRDRIIFSNDDFTIGNKKYSLKELEIAIDNNPELFSPNVLMRPVFQEFILPNVAYIGGPSELTYWLQLKGCFECVNLEYPLLILRDHFSWIDSKSISWWKDQEFLIDDLFQSFDSLIRKDAKANDVFHFDKEKEMFNQLSISINDKSRSIDSSFEKSANASLKNMEKELIRIENKLLKAFKTKNQNKINKIQKIQSKLINNGVLKERVENFIVPFLNSKDDYFDKLLETSDINNPTLKILTY